MLLTDVLKSLIIKKERLPVYQNRQGSQRFKNSNNLLSIKNIDEENSKVKIININNESNIFDINLMNKNIKFKGFDNKTIIQNAENNGIELKYSCLTGGCGACKVKKVSGNVVMEEPHCLSNNEIEDNYILACVSYPKSDIVLDI